MQRNTMVPELIVTDLRESLAFWVNLIGFDIAYERPEEGFAYLDLHGAQVMLEALGGVDNQWGVEGLARPFGRGINFQIKVESADAILRRLAEAQWPLFKECQDAWYRADEREVGQRQFLVRDPDGYLLRLAQDLGERSLP